MVMNNVSLKPEILFQFSVEFFSIFIGQLSPVQVNRELTC